MQTYLPANNQETITNMANGIQDSLSTLPEDTIIMEILPYLPAKSVGRFRAVSCAWCAALSSSTFVELHLRRANRQGQPRLFFCPSDDAPTGEEEAYFHVWQPGGPVTKLTRKPKEFRDPAPITRPVHGLHLVQSKGYYVYNATTGSSLLLPDSVAPLKMSRRYETSTQPQPPCFFDVSYGLGYCSVTAEYKAVRLFSDSYDGGPPCCEVYVLDRPAYWRPAAQQPPVCTVSEGDPGVFLGGYLHFLSVDGGIITFNEPERMPANANWISPLYMSNGRGDGILVARKAGLVSHPQVDAGMLGRRIELGLQRMACDDHDWTL
ncbi:hypothetical protein ACQ4PT_022801 [Festuca glaucescens]